MRITLALVCATVVSATIFSASPVRAVLIDDFDGSGLGGSPTLAVTGSAGLSVSGDLSFGSGFGGTGSATWDPGSDIDLSPSGEDTVSFTLGLSGTVDLTIIITDSVTGIHTFTFSPLTAGSPKEIAFSSFVGAASSFDTVDTIVMDFSGPGFSTADIDDFQTVSSASGVPEPSTFVLAALSLIGLQFFRRRRRRA